jgi:uncharacterized protein YndB with AHSA1/START domain
MAAKNEVLVKSENQDLVITRVFDVPRKLVFKMWTDNKLVKTWWGPKGFTNPVCQLDPKENGAIRIIMQGPDEMRYPVSGIFLEIKEPERLVFITRKEDEEGNMEVEIENTVSFLEEGEKTRMIFKAVVLRTTPEGAEACKGMSLGWNQSLDRLAESLNKF